MTASHRGLLFRQARHAIDVAATSRPRQPEPVLNAAAQLLASWWTQASGYGLGRQHLAAAGDLAATALVAVAAVHAGRQP